MNKLPWFTHDHDARNDEFLQRSIDKFGHFGYSAYFMLLEVIHQHGACGQVSMSKGRLALNLRSRWPQVHQYLDFCRTSGKVEFDISGDEVRLQNKKFIERQRKMKSNAPAMLHQSSGKIHLEVEVEKEREKDVITGPCRNLQLCAWKPDGGCSMPVAERSKYCPHHKIKAAVAATHKRDNDGHFHTPTGARA